MSGYFPDRSDKWVEERVRALTFLQKEVYHQMLNNYGDKRWALFVALSYPEDLESPKEAARKQLISDACKAQEQFSLDELEAYAAKKEG